jgi:hypothetical protein
MAESRASLILDLGGGDRVLAEYGRELALPVFCESVGVEPLSIYMIGPDMEDFDHILTIYRAGYFRTERSILVMNESLVLDRMAARLKARPGILDRRRDMVEHPFVSIKQWMNQGAFLMKGLDNVRAEFRLTALVYNLRRALNILGVEAMMATALG